MKKDSDLCFLSHDDCLQHEMGDTHPERPSRLEVLKNAISESPDLSSWRFFQGRLATRTEIMQAHDEHYVDSVFKKNPNKGYISLDPDTSMNRFSLLAAQRSVGSVLEGIDLIMKQNFRRAFCAVRPPGHHAEYNKAMGFCIFNNVAVGARYLLERYDIERIAVLDFDVHHGNGTEDILKDDARILFCSSFQHPFYPFSEVLTDHPRIIHTPLPANSDGKLMRKAISRSWLPALKRFKPEFLFFSAGFDAHRKDAMASLQWNSDDYLWLTQAVIHSVSGVGRDRILSTLEGGYELDSLASSAVAHLKGLMSS